MRHTQTYLLKALGYIPCSDEEIQVFMKLFTSNGLKVSEIAERTGIKRTKTYDIVEKLLAKGLIQENLKSKVKTFRTVNLITIKKILKEKLEKFQQSNSDFIEAIPKLSQLQKNDPNRTKVRYYEKSQTPKLLKQIINNHSFKAIYDPETTYKNNRKIMKEFVESLNTSKHDIREIICTKNKPLENMFRKIDNTNYNVKALPGSINYTIDTIIFDNKVYIANYNSDVAIVIEDEQMSKSFENLHDWLWEKAI